MLTDASGTQNEPFILFFCLFLFFLFSLLLIIFLKERGDVLEKKKESNRRDCVSKSQSEKKGSLLRRFCRSFSVEKIATLKAAIAH